MRFSPLRLSCLCLCLAAIVVGLPSTAQAGVRPGVEVGLNLSSLSYVDDSSFLFSFWDRRWRTSLSGGTSLQLPLRGRFNLVMGMRYVQQGNRVRYDTGPGAFRQVGEFRVVQNYLSFPVLVSWRPLPSKRVFLSLGPEVAFLLSGRLIVEESIPGDRTEYRDIEDDLEPVNLSLDAGVGFEFPVEHHVAIVGLRYSHGLTGVADEDDWISNWKTRGVEGLLGMRW